MCIYGRNIECVNALMSTTYIQEEWNTYRYVREKVSVVNLQALLWLTYM